MEPRRSIGTWTPTWKIQIRRGRKSNAYRCSTLCFQRGCTPQDFGARVSSIFSNFHLLKCQILTSPPNYGFNGKREEIPDDSKIFPSSQTPVFYLPHGRLTASQLWFAFPHQDFYPRPCCIWNPLPWCKEHGCIEHRCIEHGCWE